MIVDDAHRAIAEAHADGGEPTRFLFSCAAWEGLLAETFKMPVINPPDPTGTLWGLPIRVDRSLPPMGWRLERAS